MPINPIIRRMKGLPSDLLAAEGLMYQDWHAITSCQRACTTRLGIAIQREQESYMTKHPEILALLKIFIAKMTQRGKRKDFQKDAALNFTRPFAELDEELRTFLESPEDGPYVNMEDREFYEFDDEDFQSDLKKILCQYYPPTPWDVRTPPRSPAPTPSSSFISIQTSEITLPTPEPVPTPEPTTSQIFYRMVSNAVDKAVYTQVNEEAILYDTAYVELMKAVEEAMEIPVRDIRIDIAELFREAYHMFEINIIEKEKFAAAIAWEKRMRKKLKKSLRRQKNFKGYETPSTPKSKISSHESYKRPPPRPCECQSLANYNRYGKDRFGIYLPREEQFSTKNITTTPACSYATVDGVSSGVDIDIKSASKKSVPRSIASNKSINKRAKTPTSDDETKVLDTENEDGKTDKTPTVSETADTI
ncbi:unnamed protein product [Spodoptera littoralis]|uniref:Uncharacterized protein n=1 Tax=Spodoptera littoralis TaxID=7109 RepID=A0A9P0II21_SPOLI|nr:unnamed protein product [Spodoptera littoralis]CAH1647731.1 unnamed protein product [Spodoptera littoralis]